MAKLPNTQQFDSTFAIIGGGIAGLTAAIALKRIGIRAPVFEAAPALEPVGSGITLAYNALKALKHLEIYNGIISEGQPFHQMIIYDEHGKVIHNIDTSQIEGAVNLAVHRAELHHKLLEQVNPETIYTGKRSADIREIADGYQIEFEDATRLKSKNLIIAEGIHSVIRNKLMPEARLRYAGYTCWRGITENGLGIRGPSETWGPNGRFGIVPIGDNRIYWFACKKSPKNFEQMKAYGTNELYQEFKNYHAPVGELIRSTPPDQIIWNDIFDLEPLPQYAFGNLVLIGDAAHATTPNMGQGACQAIEDAVVLAQCLRQNSLPKEAFRRFEKKRIERTHTIVKQSRTMGKVAQWESRTLGQVRNFILRLLPRRFYTWRLGKLYDFKP